MAELYDLMLLIDAGVPEDRRNEIAGEVQGMMEDGGTVVSHHDWGTRPIAFEIRHRPEAQYHLWQFEAEPPLLDKLSHSLKITDGILRHRIIRQIPGGPPVPESPEAPRPRREEADETRVAARAAADAPPEAEAYGDGEPEAEAAEQLAE